MAKAKATKAKAGLDIYLIRDEDDLYTAVRTDDEVYLEDFMPITVTTPREAMELQKAADKGELLDFLAKHDLRITYNGDADDPIAQGFCSVGIDVLGIAANQRVTKVRLTITETKPRTASHTVWLAKDNGDRVSIHVTEPAADDDWPRLFHGPEEVLEFVKHGPVVTHWYSDNNILVADDLPKLFGIDLPANTKKRVYLRATV